jgi:hypothetical protein
MPGQTSSTVIGATWDPFIDHTSFAPGTIADFIGISGSAVNVPIGASGTLLCGLPVVLTASASPGATFAVPIPYDCALSGVALCVQGAAVDVGGGTLLTNALDITIGNY